MVLLVTETVCDAALDVVPAFDCLMEGPDRTGCKPDSALVLVLCSRVGTVLASVERGCLPLWVNFGLWMVVKSAEAGLGPSCSFHP